MIFLRKGGIRWYLSPSGRICGSTGRTFKRRAWLPYGQWRCSDGRLILFNRFYEPLHEMLPGGVIQPANPHERVRDIVEQSWFYQDGAPDKHRVAREALNRFMGNPLDSTQRLGKMTA